MKATTLIAILASAATPIAKFTPVLQDSLCERGHCDGIDNFFGEDIVDKGAPSVATAMSTVTIATTTASTANTAMFGMPIEEREAPYCTRGPAIMPGGSPCHHNDRS